MLKNLKNLRKELDLTQTQIAKSLHISQQTYSDYENCKTEPTGEMLIEIADFFGVTVDELLGYEGFTQNEQAAGASATRRVNITPLEDELIYAFRRLGKKHGESTQRGVIDMIEKMCN